jgi:CNT family concentrative nucleoside transporter
MQRVVRWVGGAIGWVTGISRVESLSAAANIFVGQSESPLTIRPLHRCLTPAQLFTVMTVGMAGVAGTILAAYASLLGNDYLPYLLAAAFMSAPGGVLMAKMLMPDDIAGTDELPLKGGTADDQVDVAETFEEGERPANIIMAAAQGAQTGVKLAVAVGAMVLAFVRLVALANGLLGGIGGWFGYPDLSFQQLVGYIFQPIMFLIGIPWNEAGTGRRPVRDEGRAQRVRRLHRPRQCAGRGGAPQRSHARDRHLRAVRLCQLQLDRHPDGGDRRPRPQPAPMIAKLGLRALLAGSLANLMSAALAGLMIPA